ncbi:MAG: pyridoxal-phosphate dependent enzyme, partial [Bacteroidia bacterium]|nr:pyridoxal-phosphate dependent enzyme [Bacteroidia bacterium]
MINWPQETGLARQRISSYLLQTPLEYADSLSRETGAEVYLKLEMLQLTGSFKLRGAANKLLSLSSSDLRHGVITASTGNHGAGVLHIARQLGVAVRVFLPKTASPAKVERLRDLGASIVQVGEDSLDSEQEARSAAEAEGIPFISPYNDLDIIAGQGTMTLEIMEQLPDLDALFVPVGGGGLIAGAGAALAGHDRKVALIGCQPANSAIMRASVEAGEILDLPSFPTLSDGTAGGLEPGSITFPLCQQWVDEF